MTSDQMDAALHPDQTRDHRGEPQFTPYAELRETHAAIVFLVGSRAYKLKKPVDLGFLDYSTRAKRLSALRKELDLNRRLAPDVYLGISDVSDADGGPMDHLLVMRRMPDQRRLARLVRSGADTSAELRQLAEVVARFHARCARSPEINKAGSRDAVRRRWQANLEEAWPFVGTRLDHDVYDDIRSLAERYLRGRAPLFAARAAAGAVLDGHGDLLAEDIFCLPDGPRILDCLEFDPALRHVDQIDDVACLALDLERLGDPEAAGMFMGAYLAASRDRITPSLLDHYLAYRAFVRAKVACLPGAADVAQAEELLELARWHLRKAQVNLVLIGGAPGAGKTSAARALAAKLGYRLFSSDQVRKEVVGVPFGEPTAGEFGAGIYSPEWTRRTYAELLRRAERYLALGESVILDATWADQHHRSQASRLAEHTASDFGQFHCDLPEAAAAERIEARPEGASDADAVIASRVRARFDAWPEAIEVSTDQPVAGVVARVEHRLQPWRQGPSVARPRLALD